MKQLIVIWDTLRLQMKNSFIRPMYRFCLIAAPIVQTILLYEMYKNSGQDNFTTYVMLGGGLMGLWSCICFSSAGDINRERYMGTLSLIFVTPANFSTIIFGKVLGNTVLSLGTDYGGQPRVFAAFYFCSSYMFYNHIHLFGISVNPIQKDTALYELY